MLQANSYEHILGTSLRAAWNLDDVLREGQDLDFSRPFLPESLARTGELDGLTATERLLLNQISAHQYLALFVIVEEFILPFLLDHGRPAHGDDYRTRAVLNFAGEEAKHIHLFRRFHRAFVRGFPVECEVIGPSEEIGGEVLRHGALAVALVVLMFEWMSQAHYVGSIKGDGGVDPLFKSLMRNHWVEEAQHARLDALLIAEIAEGMDEAAIDGAIDEFLAIAAFLDGGLAQQVQFNLDALEKAGGRPVPDRDAVAAQQHQAARATYILSGATHPKFIATLARLSPRAAQRVAEAAKAFA